MGQNPTGAQSSPPKLCFKLPNLELKVDHQKFVENQELCISIFPSLLKRQRVQQKIEIREGVMVDKIDCNLKYFKLGGNTLKV